MKLLVVFGGCSAEHDVSVASGWAVACGLRTAGHDVTAAHIDRAGLWRSSDEERSLQPHQRRPHLLSWPDADPWMLLTGSGKPDVVMAVMHGPLGEDGAIVALSQLAGVAFVGAGLTSSAVCLDKTITRDVLAARGIAQTRWFEIQPGEPVPHFGAARERLDAEVVFVKPANLGSSIGISRVDTERSWAAAVAEASSYDDTVIVEAEVAGREISVSIMGDRHDGLETSELSETSPHGAFLDHADKYGHGAAMAQIPADVGADVRRRVRALAVAVARALRVDGLARVDLFLTSDDRLLVNEVNTMPGFTAESTFPRMWAESGMSFPELLERLCELALRRHQRVRRRTDVDVPEPPDISEFAANSSDSGGHVTIRTAEPADWVAIGEVTVAAYSAVPGRPRLPDYDQALADTAERARRLTLLVAEGADGQVIGAVGFTFVDETEGRVGRARQVAVIPSARGLGVGRALITEAMTRLRAAGATEMIERTASYMSGAQTLYASLGFERAPEWDEVQADGPTLLGFHRHL